MQKISRRLILIAFLVLTLLIVACNGQKKPVYTTISEAAIHAGDPIPSPSENIILTVTGNIGTTNDRDQIVMDIPTIESLDRVEYTVMDPFKDVAVTYRGVLMSDLLDLWQVNDEATTLQMTALNDYMVEVPISLIREFPIVFAMQADGEYMPISDKGPAMLVLPYDDYEFERPSSDAYWIWQIKSVDVN